MYRLLLRNLLIATSRFLARDTNLPLMAPFLFIARSQPRVGLDPPCHALSRQTKYIANSCTNFTSMSIGARERRGASPALQGEAKILE
jgi:hypothetical protein